MVINFIAIVFPQFWGKRQSNSLFITFNLPLLTKIIFLVSLELSKKKGTVQVAKWLLNDLIYETYNRLILRNKSVYFWIRLFIIPPRQLCYFYAYINYLLILIKSWYQGITYLFRQESILHFIIKDDNWLWCRL